jgi:hypothetical protein
MIPGQTGTSCCQSNVAVETDLGQSGRMASVDIRSKQVIALALKCQPLMHIPRSWLVQYRLLSSNFSQAAFLKFLAAIK